MMPNSSFRLGPALLQHVLKMMKNVPQDRSTEINLLNYNNLSLFFSIMPGVTAISFQPAYFTKIRTWDFSLVLRLLSFGLFSRRQRMVNLDQPQLNQRAPCIEVCHSKTSTSCCVLMPRFDIIQEKRANDC